ncbi:hypothetical protein [Cohnella sp. AR92]|uniref:hypothetical protein n=1 Tax=Cohnella sp. AR92 TaxID=648716 RepID=UPI000F8E3A8E|nr:hypothetical protein [Cohnella sp. AR92]RUS46857.1 hypothetical protein ELR57_10630 [Cohnella sp. AR92]
MIKKVQNEMEAALFNYIWMTVWREKNFEFEFSTEYLGRYLSVTPLGEAAGTAEFKPYRPEDSRLDSIAPFSLHPWVAVDPSKAIEVDKIAFLKEHRGPYLTEMLTLLVGFCKANGYHYLLSLMEPVFYRALRITYRVPTDKVGRSLYYKGDTVIPVIFDVKSILEYPAKYDWLDLDVLEGVELPVLAENVLTR